MKRVLVYGAACLFALSAVPAFALLVPAHAGPAPEADVGLASLVMVGAAAAFSVYWRKRNPK